jgi:predicted phage terminase large subunit-like protein
VREAGDPLWEERFPKSMFPATRARLGSYGWAGQMQQRPSPLGGGMFQRSWWKFYDKLPEKFDHLFFSIDCAFKDKNTSDYVAGIAIGQVGANFYLLPIAIHDRLSFGRTKEAIGLLSEKIPGAGEKLVEDKANGTAVIDDLRDSIPGLIAVEPQGGKMARAHVASPFVESGNILLPAVQQFLICASETGQIEMVPSTWTDGFIEEHAAFPNGAQDDWVDTLSQAIIRATQGRPGFLEFLRREAEAAIEKRKQEQEAATAKKGTVVQKGNMMINGPNAYIRRHQP